MRARYVLIVEPDAFLAGIYAAKFSQEQMKTKVAETVAEAKKTLKKSTPSAIVLEIAVDDKQGFDFIHDLRHDPKTFALPIFVLTELAHRDDIGRAFSAGATDYLIKGHFVPIEAVRKVKKALQ